MRERLRQPMLNAVRAFEATARHGSLKVAAEALGVTPSAVSHQVRQLQDELGKQLFIRRNNAIELTLDGRRLFEEVRGALHLIARATDAIRMDRQVVAMNVTTWFALHWLVPRLSDFQKRHPGIAIEMAVVRRPVIADVGVEMTISYSLFRPPVAGATELLKDFAIPMAAPGVAHDAHGRARDIRSLPLISSTTTPEDADWAIWAAENNIEFEQLRVAFRFDTDSAAVVACKAGLGVALIPVETARIEAAGGALVPFGAFPPRSYGSYWLATVPQLRRPAEIFVSWLLNVAPRLQPNHRYDGHLTPVESGARDRDQRGKTGSRARHK
jgi:LysR family transcriptional regulator, glycine cleavage system transcriptional activator